MKSGTLLKITTATLILGMAANPAYAAKGGKGKGGGGDGDDDGGPGIQNASVSLESISPYIPSVVSQSFDNKGQVVFYGAMDLSEFPGTYDNGDDDEGNDLNCTKLATDGPTEGIIVIYPQSSKNPQAAEMIFWYSDVLENGESAQHLLTMTGQFVSDAQGNLNWPPTAAEPTDIELEYWEFAAENRKAQRQDCEGSYNYTGEGPWTVTVSLVE
jgi:hypothetical protein